MCETCENEEPNLREIWAAAAAEERYLRETLAMLQESYAKAAKPYMDRLVALHSRSLPQMLVPVEQAQALGLMPANV